MRYSKRWASAGIAFLVMLLLILLAEAALEVLSGDSFSSSETIINSNNALGRFDGAVASSSGGWRGGDTATWTISDFGKPFDSIDSILFAVRLNGSGWSNDNIDIQYSNDSGVTWFNAQTGVTPPTGLTIYGNYTVTSSFPTNTSLTNMRVRIIYNQNGGPDSTAVGFDGVEVYVSYTPPDTTPPNVTLHRPLNFTFVASKNVSFNYTATDDRGFRNCSIWINGTWNASNQTPITNGGFNYINITFDTDGDYRWNITCYDTANNTNTSNASFTVRIDTTAPIVRLFSPDNNSVTSTNLNGFVFNVTDAASIASCILVVDDVQKDSVNNPARDVNYQMNATLANGDRWWYVNCTDANGWTGTSELRNLSVQVTTPTIVPDKGTYEQGETVNYTGSNWQSGANVSLNVTLANGSYEIIYAVANSSNNINASQLINYNYPTGTYLVNASQLNDSTRNASATFVVTARVVNITTNKQSYLQGEQVIIDANGFSPGGNVNLTIRFPSGSNQTNMTANSTGGFRYLYNLSFSQPLGQHNITGTDYGFPNLLGNASFNVTERIPTISTNKSQYIVNESVGIIGMLFSEFATVALQIYNTVTGFIGPGFPVYVEANSTGGFNYTWNVNNTCSGNYTVLANDQNQTVLKANTSFLVWNQANHTLVQPAESVTGNRITPTLANVNRSDNIVQSVGLSATNLDGYLQFGFFPGIPQNATFRAVNITVEHRRTSNKVDTFQMYIVRNSQLITLTGTGCSGTPPDTESNTTCDLTSNIPNASAANDLSVRVNYTRSGGGAGDVEIDIAEVQYSWTGDYLGCFDFGSDPVAPTVFSMVATNPVVLTAGWLKTVECNFTVSDGNGAGDISGANATMFISPSTADSPDNNITHYTNSSCEIISQTANSKDFTCTFGVLYYANNGTWTCNGTGISIDGTGSNTHTFTVDPLYALNVTDTLLDFGNLSTGSISRNVSENITNIGNQRINISVYGYGGRLDDGNAFNCATENISIGYMRFAPNITAGYAGKQNLSSALQATRLTVPKQTSNIVQQNVSYWQVQIPANFSAVGQCNGTIVFQAEAS